MGHIELNMFERTVLFLSLPILLPVLSTMFAAHKVKDFTQSAMRRIRASPLDPDSDHAQTRYPVSESDAFHKLYNFAAEGDADGFFTVLEALEISDDEGRRRILSQVTPQKNTFLHVVAGSSGSLAMAEKIMELHRPLLFEVNKNGDNPLHVAAREGKLKLVEALVFYGHGRDVEHGVPPLYEMQNEDGNTALHEALIHGHELVAESLIPIDHIVCYTANKDDKSPLYLAAEGGYVNLVRIMKMNVDQIIEVDRHGVQGKSPLFASISSRSTGVVFPFSFLLLAHL